jgi:hypothetical protein
MQSAIMQVRPYHAMKRKARSGWQAGRAAHQTMRGQVAGDLIGSPTFAKR